MTSDKIGINHLVEILLQKGIDSVVISPGSRNAPLAISFARNPSIHLYPIVDERSAAFFAMGMARELGKPVALVSTSGSAVLNYAPALAEAYYQEIPLICLTADRPAAWIDQGESQTIRQFEVFRNFILGSFQLPEVIQNEDQLWLNNRIINDAINLAIGKPHGPVHINIPLSEPLYGVHESDAIQPKLMNHVKAEPLLPESEVQELKSSWSRFDRKLLLIGRQAPDAALEQQINDLAADPSLVVLTESTSNMHSERFFPCIDKLMVSMPPERMEAFHPQLLITIGNQVISKMVKAWLRKIPGLQHWHIDASGKALDTYQHLTRVYPINPSVFLHYLTDLPRSSSTYRLAWEPLLRSIQQHHQAYLQQIAYSDLKVFEAITQSLPDHSVLDMANSTPVRYMQLFPFNPSIRYYGNRGTSGIDGSVSTAAGAAFVSEHLHVLITGELSFLYDSNGLWHAHHKPNFKIIVINNGGGNIFRFIEGPAQLPELEEFFEVRHDYSVEHLAKAFRFRYAAVQPENDLKLALEQFYVPKDRPEILEVFTPPEASGSILKAYFKYLKDNRL